MGNKREILKSEQKVESLLTNRFHLAYENERTKLLLSVLSIGLFKKITGHLIIHGCWWMLVLNDLYGEEPYMGRN